MGPSVLAAPPTSFSQPFDPHTYLAGTKRSFDVMDAASASSTRSATHSSDSRRGFSIDRRHNQQQRHDDDDDDVFSAANSAMYQRPVKRKAVSSATTELRQLREEKALLQYELDSLQLKWRRLGVANDLLAIACDAALAKRDAKRAEAANKQLKAQLLTQQLFFASVQQLVLYDAPVLEQLRAKDAFDAMHVPLQLGTDLDSTGTAQLAQHCLTALRLAPAVLRRFCHVNHIRKATPAVPFAHVSVMGDGDFTYVASVFVCKLRQQTVERVYRAALAYADGLPEAFAESLAIALRVVPVVTSGFSIARDTDPLARRVLAQSQYVNTASGVSATQRTVLAAQLRESCGVIVRDFVDEQPGESAAPLSTCSSLMVAPLEGEDNNSVLLTRVVVNRYALLATSRRLHDDVKASLPHLNGDLLMAVVCKELQTSR